MSNNNLYTIIIYVFLLLEDSFKVVLSGIPHTISTYIAQYFAKLMKYLLNWAKKIIKNHKLIVWLA